jgi:GntR family transcriptional regulator
MPPPIPLAKAEKVARSIEADIRAGRLGHGDALQSELGLMQRFGVSRNTVRRGLSLLAQQGLIATRTGVGSFVTFDGSTIDAALGWTVAMAEGADRVETRLLAMRRGGCELADARLAHGGDYLCIDRLRVSLTTGEGISLERARLPWRGAFGQVIARGLTGRSLNLTLTELGLIGAGGEEIAGVEPALGGTEAAVMMRAPGAALLRLERITRMADGSVLEYVHSLLDPVRFGLRVRF